MQRLSLPAVLSFLRVAAGVRVLLVSAALAGLLALAPAEMGIAAASARCPATLPSELAHTGVARQLITLVAARASSTSGTLTLWQWSAGCWRRAGGPWSAWVGSAGLSYHHREGDDTTPEGAFAIGPVVYGVSPDPGVQLRYHQLVCGDWWDEDPSSPAYNTFVHVPCGQAPAFGGDSEPLWRSPLAYAYLAVIEYNTHPVVPGAGSGIFLHVSFGAPTDGCVALASSDLLEALRWLRPSRSPEIVIATAASIRGL